MRFLLCELNSSNVDELSRHYVQFHKIKKTNYYFKALFEKDSNSCLKIISDTCGKSYYRRRELKNHIFLNHYQLRGQRPAQNKLLNTLRRSSLLTIYSINFEQHSNFYDFFNSEQVVEEFLNVVEGNLVATDTVEFQGSFSLINYQLP